MGELVFRALCCVALIAIGLWKAIRALRSGQVTFLYATRPTTRSGDPGSFWYGVGVSVFCALLGVSMLVRLLASYGGPSPPH